MVYSQSAMSDSEATLMDIDIRTLLESTKLVKENLIRIKPDVLKLKGIAANQPAVARGRTLRSFQDWQCSLHVHGSRNEAKRIVLHVTQNRKTSIPHELSAFV